MSSPDEWFEPEASTQGNDALKKLGDMPKKPVPQDTKIPEKESEPAELSASNETEKPEEQQAKNPAEAEQKAEPQEKPAPRGRGRAGQKSMDME